jgi:hypothetical protein
VPEHELVAADVLRRRLATQRLVDPPPGTATDVVRLLACVQSQECGHAFWSLGMRTGGLSHADVQSEFDEGRFVRTHVLRPTWHFVAAEDLRWILAVTSPRVQQINRFRYRQLDLDQHDLDRGSTLILAALAGGRRLTRRELGTELEQGGLAIDGQRLAYLVMNAELEALICSGPMRGAQHTYAATAERLPPSPVPSADAALGELARRFFSGHGPADVKDFSRWSSLTAADAATALELAADRLERVVVGDQLLWAEPSMSVASRTDPDDRRDPEDWPDRALLVPLYDELTLSYPRLGFPLADQHPHPPGTDLFVGSVIHGGLNLGTWRRTVRGRTVEIETTLAPGAGQRARAAVADEVRRLASFLGKELVAIAR